MVAAIIGENWPMTDIPRQELLTAIAGVTIFTVITGEVHQWAIRSDPGGPFSSVLAIISTIGPVSLALLGGGLLVVASWLLGLGSDGEF